MATGNVGKPAEVVKAKYSIGPRIGMQVIPCEFCTKPGQVSDVKMAVYNLYTENSSVKGACPSCVTKMETDGTAFYAAANVKSK